MVGAERRFTSLRPYGLQVIERCIGHTSSGEDVVGHASGPAGHAYYVAGRVSRRQQRVVNVGVIEILVGGAEVVRVVELRVGVVFPIADYVAPHPEDGTIIRVLVIIEAVATLDVAPANLDLGLIGRVQLVCRSDLRWRTPKDSH